MYEELKKSWLYNKPVDYWNSLETEEELTAAFKYLADERFPYLKKEGENAVFYEDEEFKEVAEELKPLAEKMVLILKDILDHLPHDNERCEDLTKRALKKLTPYGQKEPQTLAAYTALLITALDSDYIDCIESGFTIPQLKAARKAYSRYLALKNRNAVESE